MSFCQNCGTEVNGSFCPNCGTPAGAVGNTNNQPIIHENAIVKPRYSVGHIALAGYLGISFLVSSLIVIICGIVFLFNPEFSFSEKLIFPICGIITLIPTYLCYLPGIKSIRKNTPEDEIKKTTVSFFFRSLVFVLAWGVSIAGCLYIIGLFFKVWRLGMSVSKPKDNEYTAFVNGKMISVFRIVDLEYSNNTTTRYMYVDDNGEYYRPSLR